MIEFSLAVAALVDTAVSRFFYFPRHGASHVTQQVSLCSMYIPKDVTGLMFVTHGCQWLDVNLTAMFVGRLSSENPNSDCSFPPRAGTRKKERMRAGSTMVFGEERKSGKG